jgi:hypothetical protein
MQGIRKTVWTLENLVSLESLDHLGSNENADISVLMTVGNCIIPKIAASREARSIVMRGT